jgi:predicted ATPase/class 3 adenylate cyclase
MSNSLPTLAAFVPPGITHSIFQAQAPAPPTAAKTEPFPAAVLFADVSGFTPLTEALAQKGAEGPEELTRLLNGYFSRMIALIEAEGGEVVKFSGDAVTVIFPARDETLAVATRRAAQAARAMQAAMAEFTTLKTSAGLIALGMKIGIGAGQILAAQVGGLNSRWEYVIAGDPLRQVAEAEHQAQQGDVILSQEAEALIAPQPVEPRPLTQPDWSQVQDSQAVEAALRCFVPGTVTARLEEALMDWLAELRPMSVLFIGINGLDYQQPDAIERLHNFLGWAQGVMQRYEGSINKVAVDDKGTIMIALFGAPPFAHEDDPERALRCAMDLQKVAYTQDLTLAIGVTTGRVFAGPVGSETRREYTVMGDTVNLSARLMVEAGPGQIRCDFETYRSAQARLAFDILPPVRVKGKAGMIRIYRPTGEATQETRAGKSGALIGRGAELAKLAAALDDIQARHDQTRCIVIEGEAGIGKSRLIAELVQLMRERGVAGLLGMGRSIEQQTPYRAWRDIFSSYFGIDEIEDLAERQRLVTDQVADVLSEQVERLPLLNDVLNLSLPENDLTASLDSHLRHESLVSFLLALLRAWAAERPLVLVLEDAHWLDSLSWDLTLQVIRALAAARVSLLLIVAMRPLEGEAMRVEPITLSGMDETEHVPLGPLTPDETVALAAARLDLADDGLPEAIAGLVRSRADGNPFFAEELIYALRDGGLISVERDGDRNLCLVLGDLTKAAQALPETIEGIILSRIDRLPAEEQLALKVAAVIGRTFAFPTLQDVLGDHMEMSERLLRGYLDDLAYLDLTPIEAPEPELTYIFKHIITQEVAYETLLFAQRRQLHRTVGQWYEGRYGRAGSKSGDQETSLAPYYPLLVYHWRRAEDREQERHYARLAGHWAAAQFANSEAASYFSRALELTPDTELEENNDLLLAREAVNDLRGEREAQAEDLVALVLLGEAIQDDRRGAEVSLRQANYLEVTSDYPEALVAAQRAVAQARLANNAKSEAEGYIIWGKVLWRQGDYDGARIPLEDALTLARTKHIHQSEARSLYYLGHVYLYQSNHASAQDHYQQAIEIYRSGSFRQGEGDSINMLGLISYELGDYTTARDYFEQALTIYHTIGDRLGETNQLNNLGMIYCDLGDFEAARDYHEQALDLRLTINDRWGEAMSLTNLGLVHHNLMQNKLAQKYCEQALAIQREIGDRHSESYSLTYLGHALADLGNLEEAAGVYRQARQLRLELGNESLSIDNLAGLARVALAKGNQEQAVEHTKAITTWLDEHGSEGVEYPLQVQLTCYNVLRRETNGILSDGERANALLAKAHTALLEKAATIGDDSLKRKFLENVKTNREIMGAWALQNKQK